MKFGSIVRNEWASDDNPQKVLMVVRQTSRYIHCLSLKGEEVKCPNDKKLRLTLIGTANFSTWSILARRQAEEGHGT